jgi:hypothetical protein
MRLYLTGWLRLLLLLLLSVDGVVAGRGPFFSLKHLAR